MQKILIVEDDEKLRNELEIFLNNNGYEVQALKEFNDTINRILKIDPDLLLLDINLPEADGEYICKELRKKSQMPIISPAVIFFIRLVRLSMGQLPGRTRLCYQTVIVPV